MVRKQLVAGFVVGGIGLLVLVEGGGPFFNSLRPAQTPSPAEIDDKPKPTNGPTAAPTRVTVAPASSAPRLTVRSKSLGAVRGAIVCHDYVTVHDVYEQYTASLESSFRYGVANAQTHGHAKELYGEPPDSFDFESYGCQLIPNGKPMELLGYIYDQIPIVRVRTPKGGLMKGVTLPDMVTTLEK